MYFFVHSTQTQYQCDNIFINPPLKCLNFQQHIQANSARLLNITKAVKEKLGWDDKTESFTALNGTAHVRGGYASHNAVKNLTVLNAKCSLE